MSRTDVRFCVLTALVLLNIPLTAQAQWFGDVAMEGLVNDNLPRAQLSTGKFEDSGISLRAAGGHHWQPLTYTGLTVGTALTRRQFAQYSGMSHYELGINAALNHKFGLGPQAPVLTFAVDLSRSRFNSDARDAWNQGASVSLGKRVTDALGLTAIVRYENSDADYNVPKPGIGIPGNAWDQRAWNLALQGELDLNEVSWLSARYDFRSGDIVSTGSPNAQIFFASNAITPDPVYGPLATAYRMDARTHGISFDYNHAFGAAGTVYAGVERQQTHGTRNIDYGVTIIRTGLIYSF